MSEQQVENKEHEETTDNASMSRRKFLANTGYAVGGLVVGGVLGYLLPKNDDGQQAVPANPQDQQPGTNPAKNYNEALMFFTQEQFLITQAAAERIYPADENGPGAADLGVAYFIDHQLAGDWGFNAREYMQPPFFVGEKTQGYQGRLRRREIFYIGLREMQNYSYATYGKSFVELTPEEQDEVLTAFQDDKVNITTISASGFFNMLRSAVLEGVYSDPMYGGNKNMQGWLMRKYPGAQMSYANIIDKEFTEIPPVSLRDLL